jgi:hypothetical protein
VIPQTPKHDLLRAIHELVRPKTYLEIGVQTGRSLAQARPGTISVGVDPHPVIGNVVIENPYVLFPMTSDEFFAHKRSQFYAPYDMVFIDGMHLIENVMRDYSNSVKQSRPDGRTVIVIDDVLPHNPAIATREPLPGDWTGDVWKMTSLLLAHSNTTSYLVDVEPTGLLIVWHVHPDDDPMTVDHVPQDEDALTQYELDEMKKYAVTPEVALDAIREFLRIDT